MEARGKKNAKENEDGRHRDERNPCRPFREPIPERVNTVQEYTLNPGEEDDQSEDGTEKRYRRTIKSEHLYPPCTVRRIKPSPDFKKYEEESGCQQIFGNA